MFCNPFPHIFTIACMEKSENIERRVILLSVISGEGSRVGIKKGGDDMNIKNMSNKGITTAMIAVAMFVGVIAGSTVLSAKPSSAQTVTPATASNTAQPQTNVGSNATNGTPTGTFKSNENPTHEAQESSQREAQENAGQVPTVK